MARSHRFKEGFTLVELLIVVLILGILGAVVLPQFTDADQEAREAALQADLAILQKSIERYHLQHNDTYPGNISGSKTWDNFVGHLTNSSSKTGGAGTDYGPYLRTGIPANPVNGLATGIVGAIPGTADGTTGWYYDPDTGEIRANCIGNTRLGTPFIEMQGVKTGGAVALP